MKKLLKIIGLIAGICFGAGLIVSKLEKKKGWVEEHKPYGFYEKSVKRPLDFGLALFAVIFLWPVILVTGIFVRLKLGKPVVFTQERAGLGGEIFTIRKFRTMLDGKGSDEERLTDFGRKLRATSLDELPELYNILSGDMSIVGPRPLLVEYLPRYNERQAQRHEVRPGLTGLAQVSGRNGLSWDEKFEDDVKYMEHITFIGDWKIILQTMVAVVRKDGISSDSSVTMEKFMGNK